MIAEVVLGSGGMKACDRHLFVNDSRLIKEVMYWIDDFIMEVYFVAGGIYRYNNIPPRIFGKIAEAKSPGKYFLMIRDSLTDFTKVK